MIKPGFLLRRDERLGQRFFSLNDLDRKLESYLDFDGGFFIEAGANDGVAQSNTLYFERHRAWRGLLVEPMAPLAWRCRTIRPGALTVNVALGAFEQRNTRLKMTYCNLMSTVDGALASAEEQDAHLRAGAAVQKIQTYPLSVPCVPLSDLIDRYHIGKVDLLSLDVEGYEENALRGLDLTRHQPRYMLVEARYRRNVENVIEKFYETVAELTERDILYRSRTTSERPVTWGWRYAFERAMLNSIALSGWYR